MRILTASRAQLAPWLSAIAIAIAAMTAGLVPGAFAQTAPAMPLQSPAEIVAGLQKGGYIVYFRHTATDFSKNDQNMKDFDDCANQRNLTDDGRAQARKVGAAWKRLTIPVGRVLASPFCRTREVAQPMFGRYERALDVRGGPSSPQRATAAIASSAASRGTSGQAWFADQRLHRASGASVAALRAETPDV